MNTTTIKQEDIWKCPRCGNRRPCPRGGCESVIIGHKVVTTTIEEVIYNDPETLDKVNLERGSVYYLPIIPQEDE